MLGGGYGALSAWRGRPHSSRAAAAATALLDEAVRAQAAGEPVRISPTTLREAGKTVAREAGARPRAVDAGLIDAPAGEVPPAERAHPLPAGVVEIAPTDRAGFVGWIRQALSTPGNAMRAWLGRVSDSNVAHVADQAGVDIAGYRRVWEQSYVRHVDNDHGPNSIAVRKGGEAPMTPDEMARYREIVDQPDRVAESPTRQGHRALVYEKQIGDWYYYVEEVRAGKRTLALATMYRRRTPDPTMFGRRGVSDKPDASAAAVGSPRSLRPKPMPAHAAPESIAPGEPGAIPRAGELSAPPGALRELEPAYAALDDPARLWAPADPAPEPPPALPEPGPATPAETADAMGLDLDGGHDLEAVIGQLGDEGRLSPDAAAELDAATALVERADAYARAYEAAAACLIRLP